MVSHLYVHVELNGIGFLIFFRLFTTFSSLYECRTEQEILNNTSFVTLSFYLVQCYCSWMEQCASLVAATSQCSLAAQGPFFEAAFILYTAARRIP